MYYRNAQAALVVYDVTKKSSLVKARHWVAELQRQASPGIVVAVAGNKADLVEGESEEVSDAAETSKPSGEEDTENENADEGAKDGEEKLRQVSKSEAQAFADEQELLFPFSSDEEDTDLDKGLEPEPQTVQVSAASPSVQSPTPAITVSNYTCKRRSIINHLLHGSQ